MHRSRRSRRRAAAPDRGPAERDGTRGSAHRSAPPSSQVAAVLRLQRTAGNAATRRLLTAPRRVPRTGGPAGAAAVFRRQETHSPHEPPLLAQDTVERARTMKRQVDRHTEPLVASALALSEGATPVIERFGAAHAASQSQLRSILTPWLPESRIDLGTVASVAVGLSLLPVPAKAFYAVAKEIAVGITSSTVGSAVTEAQEATEAARRGMQLARWMRGTREVAEALHTSRSIVRQNYDTAAKLQLAVLRPWNDLTRAEDRGDRGGGLRAAARFVAVAPTFLRESRRATEASRELTRSYALADRRNSTAQEVRRKLAVVLPDVMTDLRSRKGVIGMEGADARGDFMKEVLVGFYSELSPRSIYNQQQSRHSIADIHRMIASGSSLLRAPRGAPRQTRLAPELEYRGRKLETRFGYRSTLEDLRQLAEEHTQTSLPAVEDAIRRGMPWVMEPSVIITHFVPRSTDEQAATALRVAAREARAARRHWGRMAGVVPS